MKHSVIALFACHIIACTSMTCNAQQSTVSISPRDLENLAIIGTAQDYTLENVLNHCLTNRGKEYFKQSLISWCADPTQLAQRQADIAHLADRPDIIALVRQSLNACALHEDILHQYLSHTDAVLEEFYFKQSCVTPYNQNSWALNATYFLHYIHLCAPLLEHALLHIGIATLFDWAQDKPHDHEHTHDDCHHHHHHGGCSHGHDHTHASENTLYYAVQTAHWMSHLPGYYEIMTHIQQRDKKIAHAQNKIAHMAAYLAAAQRVYQICITGAPDIIHRYCPTLIALCDPESPEAAHRLVDTLIQSSWDSCVQRICYPGKILAIHAQITHARALFHQLAHELAIIDAYINVAHLLASSSRQYCLVHFVTQDRPLLKLDGLWHHAIAPERMIPLDIDSDDQPDNYQVMRGPNGSGKSTLLTALGHALFLAHSWGIAPAAHACMTPYSHIYTHALKWDSITRGLSHFYYEHAYYEAMLSCKEGHTIALLDEPYTGTDHAKGISSMTQLYSRIAEQPNLLAFIATHYDQ